MDRTKARPLIQAIYPGKKITTTNVDRGISAYIEFAGQVVQIGVTDDGMSSEQFGSLVQSKVAIRMAKQARCRPSESSVVRPRF